MKAKPVKAYQNVACGPRESEPHSGDNAGRYMPTAESEVRTLIGDVEALNRTLMDADTILGAALGHLRGDDCAKECGFPTAPWVLGQLGEANAKADAVRAKAAELRDLIGSQGL